MGVTAILSEGKPNQIRKEEETMTTSENLIKNKLGLLELSKKRVPLVALILDLLAFTILA
jgi:hypothetical protein